LDLARLRTTINRAARATKQLTKAAVPGIVIGDCTSDSRGTTTAREGEDVTRNVGVSVGRSDEGITVVQVEFAKHTPEQQKTFAEQFAPACPQVSQRFEEGLHIAPAQHSLPLFPLSHGLLRSLHF